MSIFTDSTGIIREERDAAPDLAEGENLLYEAQYGMAITTLFFAIILTFIPPFVLGALILWIERRIRSRSRLLITNFRILEINRGMFQKKYQVVSVPIERIKRLGKSGRGLGDCIDRLFGVGDVQIWFKGSILSQYHIHQIKSPRRIIDIVNNLVSDEADALA